MRHLSLNLAALLGLTPTLSALEIRDYQPNRHDRFLDFQSAPKINQNFLYSSTNLTGVGWYLAPSNTTVERRRQYTMVSPRHFVGAAHFPPSTNGNLSFLSSDGVVRTYAIGSLQAVPNPDGEPSDLLLGTLEGSLTPGDGVDFQPFLSLPEQSYLGQELIFMGHERTSNPTLRAGRAVLQARTQFGEGAAVGDGTGLNRTEVFSWTYEENTLISTGDPDDSFTEPGDSGGPSLADVDGRGALVGTHTAAGSARLLITSSNTSYDAFVPFYVEQLNEIMAEEGYHMTRAVPGPNQPSAPLDLSIQVPETIRAAYPLSLPVTVTNTADDEQANNLKFAQTLPEASAVTSSGEGWVASEEGPDLRARKGGLPADEQSLLTVTFTPLKPGSFKSTFTHSADESEEATVEVTLNIIESYRSWSSSLTDDSFTADPDRDGVSNLQEYAFGGDPTDPSLRLESDGGSLLPTLEVSANGVTVDFLQRSDADQRALSYLLESSDDLSAGSWEPVTGQIGETERESAGSGLERVRMEVSAESEARFYRVKVVLNE